MGCVEGVVWSLAGFGLCPKMHAMKLHVWSNILLQIVTALYLFNSLKVSDNFMEKKIYVNGHLQ